MLLDANLLAGRDREKHLQDLAKTNAYVDFNQGLDVRLINDDITELINQIRIEKIHFAWDNYDDMSAVEGLKKYAQKATRKPHGSFGIVYILVNFNTTHVQDLERVYRVREMGYDPYIMIFDKPNAPKKTKHLQRWCNNKIIFKSCDRFEDFDTRK